VSPELRKAVIADQAQHWQYTSLHRDSGDTVPALAIGSTVAVPAVGTYELYFIFPLDKEQETIGLIRRTLAGAALGLVLLVGGVAALVTRQVVTPVRMAARISERLASGRLEERMRVRGEDDLARLGASFNKMATNLQRQIRQLEELSRVQRRFVSDVSHELRTPLTTVRMAADVLHEARPGFDPVTARSAELLQAELDRFESLLTGLLEISRYDAGAAVLEPEPLDLCALVDRVVDGVRALADRSGTSIRTQFPAHAAMVEADPRRIERILRNLLVNAIEYGEGRPVHVRVAVDDTAAAVSVRDHGVGLRPGEAAQVFNRFWRADPARARTSGGTGLGLSIAQEDALLHGGWLQAWGEPGDGSSFRLTLPREPGVDLDHSPLPLEPATKGEVRVGGPYQRIEPAEPAQARDA
jgi:two-component system sensor histidine kinase MtrB